MANFELYQELVIRLPSHEYPIFIGHHALTDEKLLRQYVSQQVMIVTNTTIAPLYLKYLQTAFTDRQCDIIVLEDGEEFKNKDSLFFIYDALIAKQHHRDTTLIALGGGVVGDITGFAAATYQRGVQFLQIPTTLLAQVDASIGGKTAINHSQAKNMIGSFYQPRAVIIDLLTLQTLPLKEFRAGIAEVIKYALLAGGKFFDLVYSALKEGFDAPILPKLPEMIAQSCQIKAKIVQADEREAGQRALLNLGHTFAHALEAYTHYHRWLHGEAVAIGLYCAALFSYQLGHIEERDLHLVDKMLMMSKLPRRIPADIDLGKLRALISQDKKIKNMNLRFILMRAIGHCYIEDKISEDSLSILLQSAVEGD